MDSCQKLECSKGPPLGKKMDSCQKLECSKGSRIPPWEKKWTFAKNWNVAKGPPLGKKWTFEKNWTVAEVRGRLQNMMSLGDVTREGAVHMCLGPWVPYDKGIAQRSVDTNNKTNKSSLKEPSKHTSMYMMHCICARGDSWPQRYVILQIKTCPNGL